MTDFNISEVDYVKWVQRSLNRILGPHLVVNGVKTDLYYASVGAFQEGKLAVTSVVDKPTHDELVAVNHATPVYVRWIVKALRSIVDPALPESDIVETKVLAAINSFQRYHSGEPYKLKEDGWVGAKTEKALLIESAMAPPGAYIPGAPKPKPKPEVPKKPDPVTTEQLTKRHLKRFIAEVTFDRSLHPDREFSRELVYVSKKLLVAGYDQKYIPATQVDQYLIQNQPPKGGGPLPMISPSRFTLDAWRLLQRDMEKLRSKSIPEQYEEVRTLVSELVGSIRLGINRMAMKNNFHGYEKPQRDLMKWLEAKHASPTSIYSCFKDYSYTIF